MSCEDGCVVVIANVCRKLKLCASLKYYNSVVGLFFFSSDRMLSVQLLMENFRPQRDQSFVYTYKIHWTQSMVSREITRHTSRQIGQCGRNLRHQNHSNRKGDVLCSCQVSGVPNKQTMLSLSGTPVLQRNCKECTFKIFLLGNRHFVL